MNLLLMGNPNVGKSALFSRLTGIKVTVSNYPGTTVEFKQGKMKHGAEFASVIDVPGAYTLEPTSRAEEVAMEMLELGDLVINVVDATNLERNLYLTLQLLERNIPTIMVLNFWDETKHRGIRIDADVLEEMLGIPVIPIVAVTGEGVNDLIARLDEATPQTYSDGDSARWIRIGNIVKRVQTFTPKHHTFLEKAEDLTIKPVTGIPFALIVLALTFLMVRVIGEVVIRAIFDPLFGWYLPVAARLSTWLGPGWVHDMLIGTLINGGIDFTQSMGLLTTGLYVPVAMVLPYVFAFYVVLGVLEDSGYLPRLATLVDTLMHRLGMHGAGMIPMLLGLGCNVPGALSTRMLKTRRQRFIAATLMAVAVPCMAQTAMIFGLLGPYGLPGFGLLFATLFIVWVGLGLVLNKCMTGSTPETFMEIPPYRVPYVNSLGKKLGMRLRSFITTAIPFMLLGVFLVNLLYISGIIALAGDWASPVIVKVLGLPKEAVASLLVGFLRKDVAVGMLLPLNLTMKQLVIAGVALTMYFPCVATFVVLFRELGIRDLVKSVGIMVALTLLVGGTLNLVL